MMESSTSNLAQIQKKGDVNRHIIEQQVEEDNWDCYRNTLIKATKELSGRDISLILEDMYDGKWIKDNDYQTFFQYLVLDKSYSLEKKVEQFLDYFKIHKNLGFSSYIKQLENNR